MIELPYVGWYAEKKTYKYKPDLAYRAERLNGLTLDSTVQPMCLQERFKRPFKGALVEMLATIRDRGGDVHCDANLTPAVDWLEANEMIVPVAADKYSPYAVNILYALTDKGKAFLTEHEAPEYWQ